MDSLPGSKPVQGPGSQQDVKLDMSTAKASYRVVSEVEVKDTQGNPHVVSFSKIIESVGNQIREAKNEDELGKAHLSLKQVEALGSSGSKVFDPTRSSSDSLLPPDDWGSSIQDLQDQFKSRTEEVRIQPERLGNETIVGKQEEKFQSREDYVEYFGDYFREYFDTKEKIVSLKQQINRIERKPEEEQNNRQLKKLKAELKDLTEVELPVIKELINEARFSFPGDKEALDLGEWSDLLKDVMSEHEFWDKEEEEIQKRWGKELL